MAEDHGVDHNVKLPAGGLEVTDDGWLRVAQPDNVGVCSGNSRRGWASWIRRACSSSWSDRTGRTSASSAWRFATTRRRPSAFAPSSIDARSWCPDRRDGGGGYVGAPISFDGIAAAHVAADAAADDQRRRA